MESDKVFDDNMSKTKEVIKIFRGWVQERRKENNKIEEATFEKAIPGRALFTQETIEKYSEPEQER